jgi:hypothetical protein
MGKTLLDGESRWVGLVVVPALEPLLAFAAG